MQISSFQLRSMLVAAGVAASVTSACAQTYEFKGYIDTSRSTDFLVGDSIDFKVTLGPAVYIPPFPGANVYGYSLESMSMLIGGTEYANTTYLWTAQFASLSKSTGSNGSGDLWGPLSFNAPLRTFDLQFVSSSTPVLDSNGILLSGIPLSDFQNPGGTLTDDSYDFSSDSQVGEASWKMTEYSVLPLSSPVPEPSTYGFVGAALLAGVVAIRRRKR